MSWELELRGHLQHLRQLCSNKYLSLWSIVYLAYVDATNYSVPKSTSTILLPEITVGVIDDDIFEEDEYFYVHLSNPRVVGYPEIGTAPLDTSATPKAVLGDNHTATVTIYDDDHAGMRTLWIMQQES